MRVSRRVPMCALFVGLARAAAAQETAVTFEEQKPVTVSGFAVGLASYDRNARENSAAGSKVALSLFRPWSDQLYFFGQLTTSLGRDDSTGAAVT